MVVIFADTGIEVLGAMVFIQLHQHFGVRGGNGFSASERKHAMRHTRRPPRCTRMRTRLCGECFAGACVIDAERTFQQVRPHHADE